MYNANKGEVYYNREKSVLIKVSLCLHFIILLGEKMSFKIVEPAVKTTCV